MGDINGQYISYMVTIKRTTLDFVLTYGIIEAHRWPPEDNRSDKK